MAFGSPQWMYASGADYYEYKIPYSCKFDAARSTNLARTLGTPTNTDKWVFSCWVKKSEVDGAWMSILNAGLDGSGTGESDIGFNASENLIVQQYNGGYVYNYVSNAKFRDPNAWMNIVVAHDTTQATASNRVLVYVNGVLITNWSTETNPSQNLDSASFNAASQHRIGNERSDSREFNGYLAEMHFIDGMSFFSNTSGTANSSFNIGTFGETGDYGDWKPVEIEGVTYGDNGFYLDFANSAALGNDVSGENNDWTVTNLAASDQMLDSPTNNFCTLDRLGHQWPKRSATMTEGNLRCWDSSSDWTHAMGTMPIPNDKKIYFEVFAAGQNFYAGVALADPNAGAYSHGSRPDGGWIRGLVSAYTASDTSITVYRATVDGTALGSQNFTGLSNVHDGILGIAIDQGATDVDDRIRFYINGSLAADNLNPANCLNTTGEYLPIIAGGGSNLVQVVNFGQDSSFGGLKTAQGNQDANGIGDFYYAPPSGYLALCASTLSAVAVTPSEHFNTILYTGNGTDEDAGGQPQTGVGFQPDFVWIKSRNTGADNSLYDSVRGVNKKLKSNEGDAEFSDNNALTVFGTDGFTVADDAATGADGITYAAWNWKAGGTGVANTNGSINSTVSANADAGFSIVSYTGNTTAGATVGHGLSKAPQMVITKQLANVGSWQVLMNTPNDYAEGDYFYVNTTIAVASSANVSFLPTATTWEMEAGQQGNVAAAQIAYCFHSVRGYSKVGVYKGNGSTDGTFAYCGFRPAYILIKRTDAANSWNIQDTKRAIHNEAYLGLQAQTTAGEGEESTYALDITSNGFKQRYTHASQNADGGTYIYLAFAETPFKYSNAR